MEKVIVIIGPTASGKTKLAIELAKICDGEIISCDSMQIYKYMDIGTAKPTKSEMQGIPHHLIDVVSPQEEFSVARYKEMAEKEIDNILKKRKIPIIVGGTGLYINSLIYNIDFKETVSSWEFREKLQNEAAQFGNEYVHEKLKDIDPTSYEKLHANDLKRVIRALEVYEFTNQTITEQTKQSRLNKVKYEYNLFGLKMDRQKLYERINKRIDMMLENGLIEEVKKIKELGYDKTTTASKAIGYKEFFSWLNGECDLKDCVEKLKMESRRYAKRQITWFNKIENIDWIDIDEYSNPVEIAKYINKKII